MTCTGRWLREGLSALGLALCFFKEGGLVGVDVTGRLAAGGERR